MKLKLEVTRIDEYEVSIDETIWDSATLEEWSQTFWPLDDVEDLAKALATAVMRYGLGKSMEGFGRVKQFRPDGYEIKQYEKDEKGEYQVIENFTKGLEVIVHSEDENYYAELDV